MYSFWYTSNMNTVCPCYKTPLTHGHTSYVARFLMHWDSKILVIVPFKRVQPTYNATFFFITYGIAFNTGD